MAIPLAAAFIRLRPDVDRRDFERRAREAGERSGREFADGFTRDSNGRLRDANGRYVTEGERAGGGFGQGFNRSASKVLGGEKSILARVAALAVARFTLLGAAAAAAAPGVLHLTAALLPAAGALVALPAAMAGIAAAKATFKVAVSGVGDAITAGFSGTAKQAKKAMEELPPAARNFAKSIIELKPQVEALRKSVAQRFFLPLQDDVKPLTNLYFPLLTRQMSNLAGPLGGLGEQFAESARKARTFNAVNQLFYSTRQAVIVVRDAIDPLIRAFAALITSTGPILPQLAQGFVNLSRRVAAFIVEASRGGQLRVVFNDAVVVIKDLGGIVLNVGSILRSVLSAANAGGNTLLSTFRDLTGQVAAFLRSAQGVGNLTAVFATLGTIGAALQKSLGAVLPAIGEALQILGPAIAGLAGPAAQLVVAFAPLIPALAGTAALIIRAVTPALTVLSDFLAENEDVVRAGIIAYSAYSAALAITGAVATVQAAGGLLAWARATTLVTNVTKIATLAQTAFGIAIRFALGPIGLIITGIGLLVAAVVYLYRNNETFRKAVQAAWMAVQKAVAVTVKWITGTAVPALKEAWRFISDGAVSLWRNGIVPAWEGIQNAVRVAINVVVAVIGGVRSAFAAVGSAARTVYDAFRAAFAAVGRVVQGGINVVLAVFGALNTYLNRTLFPVVRFLYNNIFNPIFRFIAKAVEIWWLAVRVVFQAFVNIGIAAISTAIEKTRKAFTFVFAVIGGVVSNWWNKAKLVFQAFAFVGIVLVRNAIDTARARFTLVFNAIRSLITAWWASVRYQFNLFRTYILGPIAAALTATRNFFARIFTGIGRDVTAWYNGTIKPRFDQVRLAWNILATSFSSTYNTKIKPMFSLFIGFITRDVVGGFRTGVSAITTAWDKVREAARKPVAFVVNRVINPFIKGLNAAAAVVGVKDRVAPIAGFADGGQIPGRPSYRDNRLARVRGSGRALAVASGEFITNTRSSLANLPLLKAINGKRGRVTRDDIDPVLDGASGGGRVHRGGVGDGIGDFFGKIVNGFKGAAELITNPKAALLKVANAALGQIPGGGMVRDFLVGAARNTLGKAMDWLNGLGLGGSIGGAGVAGGWKGMQRLISQRFPGLGLISGFRQGSRTLSGKRSYHSMGRAVDYPPLRALAAWIKSTFGGKTKELITPFQDLNLLNGRPHTYTGAVWNQHNFAGGNAHVHWAAEMGGLISRLSGMPLKVFDSGGAWPSGTLGANLSGRTEYVDPNRSGSRGGGGGIHVHIHNSVIASERQAEDLVVAGYLAAKRKRRL